VTSSHEHGQSSVVVSVSEYRVAAGEALHFVEEVRQQHHAQRKGKVLGGPLRCAVALALEDADLVVVRSSWSLGILESAPVTGPRLRERGWGYRLPPLAELFEAKELDHRKLYEGCFAVPEPVATERGPGGDSVKWELDAVLPPMGGEGLGSDSSGSANLAAGRPWWGIVHLGLTPAARALRSRDLLRSLLMADCFHEERPPFRGTETPRPTPETLRFVPLVGLEPRAELCCLVRAQTLELLSAGALALRDWRWNKAKGPLMVERSRTVIGLGVGEAGADEPPRSHALQLRAGRARGWMFVGAIDGHDRSLPKNFRLQTSLAVPGGHCADEVVETMQERLAESFSLSQQDPLRPDLVTIARHLGYRDLVAQLDLSDRSDLSVAVGLAKLAGLRRGALGHDEDSWVSTESSISFVIGRPSPPEAETAPSPASALEPGPSTAEDSLETVDVSPPGASRGDSPTARARALMERWTVACPPGAAGSEGLPQAPHRELDASSRRLCSATLDELARSIGELPALCELLPAAEALVRVAEQARPTHARATVRPLPPDQTAKWVAALRRRMLEQTERPDPLVSTRRASRSADQPLGPGFPRLALAQWLREAAQTVFPDVCPLVRWTVDQRPKLSELPGQPGRLPEGVVLRCPMRLWWSPFQWPIALGALAEFILEHCRIGDLAEELQGRPDLGSSRHLQRALRVVGGLHAALALGGHCDEDPIGVTVSRVIRDLSEGLTYKGGLDAGLDRASLQRVFQELAHHAFSFGLSGISAHGLTWWAVGPVMAHSAVRMDTRVRHRHEDGSVCGSIGAALAQIFQVAILDKVVHPRLPGVGQLGGASDAGGVSPDILVDALRTAQGSIVDSSVVAETPVRAVVLGFHLDDERLHMLQTHPPELLRWPAQQVKLALLPEWRALVGVACAFHELGQALHKHAVGEPDGQAGDASINPHAMALHVGFLREMHKLNDGIAARNPRRTTIGARPLIPEPVYGLDSRMFLVGGSSRRTEMLRQYHSSKMRLMAKLGEQTRHGVRPMTADPP
jgi:hypothetical protein